MNIEIDGDTHEIVYIEYSDGLPFKVLTQKCITTSKKPYWRIYEWDFFANNGDKDDFRAYNSGSGSGRVYKWAGFNDEFWLRPGLVYNDEIKSGTRLKNPKPLDHGETKTMNPFTVAEITDNCEYCEDCGHDSTEFCYEHKYTDEDGNDRYIKDDSYVS
jgi:hypothetical protein